MTADRLSDHQFASYRARVRGCLLGGAIGDALGSGDRGRIGVDTQLTLFTVEGMIRAAVRQSRGTGFTIAVIHHAYDRWLDTQTQDGPDGERDGWLIGESWLYSRRSPDPTCLMALAAARGGRRRIDQFGHAASNASQGCGAVARSAPLGLAPPGQWALEEQLDAAITVAGYTHGHPAGRLAAGALAALIGLIMRGHDLRESVDELIALVDGRRDGAELAQAISRAAASAVPGEPVAPFGDGRLASEALAIAIGAALAHPEHGAVLDALALAVSHGRARSSAGAICGGILGSLHGEAALPADVTTQVEGHDVILALADDFAAEFTSAGQLDEEEALQQPDRYPGW